MEVPMEIPMETQVVQGEDYQVHYDPSTTTITFTGELSLGGPKEYEPIVQLLDWAIVNNPPSITLDLMQLTFLNSSGISMLSKFVIRLRKKKGIEATVLGSNDIAWQGKSLKNLQRLLPGLKLRVE
jgi:hypothetical protein